MKRIWHSIKLKSIAGMILMLVVFSSIMVLIGYRMFTSSLMEQYADSAFRTAESAADMVNADHLDRMLESGGKSAEYQAAKFNMERLCNSQGVTFIYVILPDRSDYGHIQFLISTKNKDSSFTEYEFGFVRVTTNDDYRQKYKALCEEGLERALVVRDKGYIQTDPHITAMIPLKGATGKVQGILCVQRQMDPLAAARRAFVRRIILTLLGAAMLVLTGGSLYLQRVLISPVEKITDEAKRFAAENVVAETPLSDIIENADEIGTLAESIDQMEAQVQDYVNSLTRLTKEKERVNAELDVAWKIQSGVLPKVFPAFPDKKEFDLYAMVRPAKEVGGDFYDYYLIDDDHLALVIADVAGKGIPGALFMMISKVLIKNRMISGDTPGEALENVNRQLIEGNQADMFVTVWMAVLEISTGKGIAVNAGHEHPALRRAGQNFELVRYRHSLAVSAMEGVPFKEHEFELRPGDTLFVYTDGVPEATDKSGRLFGTDRMLESLNREPGAKPRVAVRHVQEGIFEFVENAEQFDDITMLCLQYYGKEDKTC